MRTRNLSIICFFLLFLASCGTGPMEPSEGETTVTIGAGQSLGGGSAGLSAEVDVNSSFTATFSAPVDISTVHAGTFFVMQAASAGASVKAMSVSCDPALAIEGVVTCADDALSCTLDPSDALSASADHHCCLTSDIRFQNPSVFGYFDGVSMSFRTAAAQEEEEDADETAPTVADGSVAASNPSTTTMDLAWVAASDDITASADLLYLVSYSETASLDTLADIEANGTAFGVFAAGVTSTTVTGLIQNTAYTFNVVVKDEAGNKAIYTPATGTTQRDTTGGPSITNGTIAASGATMTSIDLAWSAATDDFDAAGDLLYRVYHSTSNDLDSVANIEANGTAFGATAAGLTGTTVTGLSSGTTYFFNVIVEDSDGNKASYTTVSEETLGDTTAPTLGSGISFSLASPVGTQVSWGAATDGVSDASALQYKVVRAATSAEIDSVAEADAITGEDLIMNWAANVTGDYALAEQGSQEFFAVLVKDEADNKALYEPEQPSALPTSKKKGLIPLSDGSIIVLYLDNDDNRYLKSIVFDSHGDYVNGPTVVDSDGVGEGQWGTGGKISGLELSNGNIVVAYSDDHKTWWGGFIGVGYYIHLNDDGEATTAHHQYESYDPDGASEFISIAEIGSGDILIVNSVVVDGGNNQTGWTSQAPRAYAYNPVTNAVLYDGDTEAVLDASVTHGTAVCPVGNDGDALVLYATNANRGYYRIYDESTASMGGATTYTTGGVSMAAKCLTLNNANSDALVLFSDSDDSKKGKLFTVDSSGNKSANTTFQDTYPIQIIWSDSISAFILQEGPLAGNIFVAFSASADGEVTWNGYYMVIDTDGTTVTAPTLFKTGVVDGCGAADIVAGEMSEGRVAIIHKVGLAVVTPVAD